MSKRKWTNETYDKWLIDNGKTFKRKEGEYIKSNKSVITHVCNIDGHEWREKVGDVVRNLGYCRQCLGTVRNRWNNETYAKWLIDNGKTFKIKEGEYVKNVNVSIIHKCDIDGHKWKTSVNNILRGDICPECKLKERILSNNAEYDKWLIDNGKTFKRKEGEYIKSFKSLITHVCNIDGREWKARVDCVKAKNGKRSGCFKCLGRIKWTNELYDKWLIDNNISFKRMEDIKGNSKPLLHRCDIDGHEWDVSVYSVVELNSRCAKCSCKLEHTNESVDEIIKIYNPFFKRISDVYILKRKNKTYSVVDVMCLKDGCNYKGTRRIEDIKNRGCPKCSKCIKYTNEIADELIKEYKINAIRISDVYSKKRKNSIYNVSQTYVWLKCLDCGYDRDIRVNSIKFNTCRKCSGKLQHTNESVDELIKKYNIKARRIDDIFLKDLICGDKCSHVNLECTNEGCDYKWTIAVYGIKRTGCWRCKASKGEVRILKYAIDNNIKYIPQYELEDCRGKKRPLPFDFYFSEYNLLIEYQGMQHTKPISFGSKKGGAAWNNFLKTNEHDNIKRNYCRDKGINFLEIFYTDFDNIEKILDEKLGELKLKMMSNKSI